LPYKNLLANSLQNNRWENRASGDIKVRHMQQRGPAPGTGGAPQHAITPGAGPNSAFSDSGSVCPTIRPRSSFSLILKDCHALPQYIAAPFP